MNEQYNHFEAWAKEHYPDLHDDIPTLCEIYTKAFPGRVPKIIAELVGEKRTPPSWHEKDIAIICECGNKDTIPAASKFFTPECSSECGKSMKPMTIAQTRCFHD